MTTLNITTSTGSININNNTDKTINSNSNPELLNNQSNVYIPTKVCNACRTIKNITEFNKRKGGRDGYQSRCKNCIDNRKNEYFDALKDEINQHEKVYYDINKNKTCNKCYQIKCVTEFYKDKSKKTVIVLNVKLVRIIIKNNIIYKIKIN